MTKRESRTPKGYDGTKTTTKKMGDVLPNVLYTVEKIFGDRPDLIMAAWPDLIGSKFVSMTRAESFAGGVLVVRVTNSTLLSLLSQYEKPKLLSKLKERFPTSNIQQLVFKIG